MWFVWMMVTFAMPVMGRLQVPVGRFSKQGQPGGEDTVRQSVKYFDMVGIEASLTFTGGYAEIECMVVGGQCQANDVIYIVHENNQILGQVPCDSGTNAKVRVNITTSTPFGKFHCRHNQGSLSSTTFVDFQYRVCDGRECNCNCSDTQFCLMTTSGPTCNLIKRWCDDQHPTEQYICGNANAGRTSMCDEIAGGTYANTYVEQNVVCGVSSALECPPGNAKKRNEIVEVNATVNEIGISCTGGSATRGAIISCNTTRHDGTAVGPEWQSGACGGFGVSFTLDQSIFNDPVGFFAVECASTKAGGGPQGGPTEAHFAVYLVKIGGITASVTKNNDGTITANVSPQPPPVFIVDYMWQASDGRTSKGQTLPCTTGGDYTMAGTVKFPQWHGGKQLQASTTAINTKCDQAITENGQVSASETGGTRPDEFEKKNKQWIPKKGVAKHRAGDATTAATGVPGGLIAFAVIVGLLVIVAIVIVIMLVADRGDRPHDRYDHGPCIVTFRLSRTDQHRNPAMEGTREMILIQLIDARLHELIREEYGNEHNVQFEYAFPISAHVPPRVEILYRGHILFDSLEWGPLNGHRMGLDVAQFVFNVAREQEQEL